MVLVTTSVQGVFAFTKTRIQVIVVIPVDKQF